MYTFLILFSEEKYEPKYLIPFCITLFIALIVMVIAASLIFKQKRLSRNDSSISPISSESQVNNHTLSSKNENANNWQKYVNQLQISEEDLSQRNDITINDEACSTVPCNPFIEKSYKNLSFECINQVTSLPYKNNLHKDLNVMACKDCLPERGVVV